MLELIEGKLVTVRKFDSKIVEMGIVKKVFGKLVVTVKRNNSMVNITPESLVSFYEIMYIGNEE